MILLDQQQQQHQIIISIEYHVATEAISARKMLFAVSCAADFFSLYYTRVMPRVAVDLDDAIVVAAAAAAF